MLQKVRLLPLFGKLLLEFCRLSLHQLLAVSHLLSSSFVSYAQLDMNLQWHDHSEFNSMVIGPAASAMKTEFRMSLGHGYVALLAMQISNSNQDMYISTIHVRRTTNHVSTYYLMIIATSAPTDFPIIAPSFNQSISQQDNYWSEEL